MLRLLCILTLFLLPICIEGSITVPGTLSHESSVKMQDSIEAHIPIQNDTDEAIAVRITLADYLFDATGQSSFPLAGSCPRSNASWISTPETQITVAPHTTYHFPYTLKVPKDPSLEGTYWSILLIEPVTPAALDPQKKHSLGIQTIIRYGVQIITHVGEKGIYDLKILHKTLENRSFSLAVANQGNRMQTPSLTLELVDMQGKKVDRLQAPKQRIFPLCSVTYQVDLSHIKPGKYKALAILDHGEDALFGAHYDLDLH